MINRYQELGIVAVGRTGTFSTIDPAEEIALAARYQGQDAPDQREALRVLVDPPVRMDDVRSSLRRFIER